MKKIRSVLAAASIVLFVAYLAVPKLTAWLSFLLPIERDANLVARGLVASLLVAALIMLIATFTSMKQAAEGLVCVKQESLLWKVFGNQTAHGRTDQVAISGICQISWRV